MCQGCTGWIVEGRLARRENQHSYGDAPEELPHRKKSKGSKANKWCRKKIGQEHVFDKIEIRYHGSTWRYKVEVCSRCHKHGKWTYQRLHTFTYKIGEEEFTKTYWS